MNRGAESCGDPVSIILPRVARIGWRSAPVLISPWGLVGGSLGGGLIGLGILLGLRGAPAERRGSGAAPERAIS